jgi:hypothetical protein
MHVRRCADPDNVDVRQRDQLRPIFYRRRSRHIFAAKFLGAFVCGIGNRYDLDIRVLLKTGQMASANDVARADDPDPQFLIVFVHLLLCDSNLADSTGCSAS